MSGMPETIASCHACGAAMDVTAVAPFSNVECPKCGKHTRVKREFGPYTLMRRHAAGGMSMVFGAHDNTLDREVALKILSEEFSADERRISAFEQEARLTASFSHPNVVRVLTTGRAFGRFYIAMEFVPGGHFERRIRECGKVPEAEVLPLAIEVAQGLKAAHAAGLIHRDVKPGNILLDAEGHAKLVDFGLALVTNKGGKAQATELWATPYYVPPETVEGRPEDLRSDIYAFGATFYHALAGKPPCDEESMATDVLREAKKRVVPLSEVAPHVSTETCRIIERAMAYSSAQRYHSYDELIGNLQQALARLKSGGGELVGTVVAKRRAEKKRRELRLVKAVVAGIAAVAGLVALISVVGNQPDSVSGPPPQLPVRSDGETPRDSGAAEVGRMYREAHEALAAKDYFTAKTRFLNLHQNPLVQEPTRSWAGVEAALVAFLEGRPSEAKQLAQAAAAHVRNHPSGADGLGPELARLLKEAGNLEPMKVSTPGSTNPSSKEVMNDSALVSWMLAGLKNWEQGMKVAARECFERVATAELASNDSRLKIYQKLAGDYLADCAILSGPLFEDEPVGKAAREKRISELEELRPRLKTQGRALYNLRAWQADLKRGERVASPPANPPAPGSTASARSPLDALLSKARDYRFAEGLADLKAAAVRSPSAEVDSLLTLTGSAAVFLSDLEQDLKKGPATAELAMRSGTVATGIAVDSAGNLSALLPDGSRNQCRWSDFEADALVSLHRLLVAKNPGSEVERLRRHECAIAFDWLAGNRERAISAANNLSQISEAFRKRWQEISAGLPE